MIGEQIHQLCKSLQPFKRSLTGDGVRQTLQYLQKHLLPDLKIHEVPSGTPAFDWTVPQEWRINDAYILRPDGHKICGFLDNPLHLVGYSIPTNQTLTLENLQPHLYSLPKQPTAIPYITSYYAPRWGFCLTQNERDQLPEGEYKVFIDSELFDGSLSYGELIIPGETKKEVFISTYICHPTMANNELSGPSVTAYLAKWLTNLPQRRCTYRFVFIPETIGSITYLSRNLKTLRENVIAGFNVTCVGDDRAYSYLPSRNGNTLSDSIAKHVLHFTESNYKTYSWSQRGSDERQYCAPGVDLPIASIMRTKYGTYPEYHTSLDDLENVVTPAGLTGGYTILQRALEAVEANCFPRVKILCEPQLGKRGLYPTLSTRHNRAAVRLMTDILTWSDGNKSLIDIANLCDAPIWAVTPLLKTLIEHDLVETFAIAHPITNTPPAEVTTPIASIKSAARNSV